MFTGAATDYDRSSDASRHAAEQARTVITMDRPADSDLMAQLKAVCSENRLHVTPQRRLVVRVLAEADDHPTVEEVHARAIALDPHISLATVYRTMRMLERSGVIDRHDFGGAKARYEQASKSHHDHLIDVDTGDVVEFRDAEIERLQHRVAKRLGYRLEGHRLALFGVALKKR